jgi:eukaryotic-like serine/threonine-protein kinase
VAGSEKLPGMSEAERTRSLAVTLSERVPAIAEAVIGQTVGRYQVRRELGRGGMGQVYLARDVVLGRSVALKLVGRSIHAERFLDEARAIARLNHPNIVQLYDYGDLEGGIYLALEYVEGETLRDRIHRGPIAADESLRHVRAIADALCHAHAAEVFHCDLKPSNVMIGRDGRVRVVDFGIARIGDDMASAQGGTPDWMAPEQWTRAALTDRVDLWALAIVTAQLLTGQHPLGDDTAHRRAALQDPEAVLRLDRDRIPEPVAELIVRSLAIDPLQRPSAAQWRRVIDDVISGRGDAFPELAPYPGLAAFDEQHARFYFGREREIDELLERLRGEPHVAIIGPSGVGKSSFLHAGVIPRMRARERWTVLAFRPGADPVGALARHVTSAAIEAGVLDAARDLKAHVQTLRAELLETPTLLAARLATLAAVCETRVLVAVDQLEEVFTQAAEPESSQFLRMLLGAADDPHDPVRVVFTVRDDYFSKIAGLRSAFALQKLGAEDLHRTITEPLTRCGYELDDPQIVDDLLAELGSAKVSDLPLVQFACSMLWDGRDATTRRLRRASYHAMGGLAGALAQHAERALAEQSPDERRASRRLLLQLVSGTTRRSVARAQLIASAGRDAPRALESLLSARLLVQDGQSDGDHALVEIAHESLLQTWSQLARWIDESRDERRLLDELQDATSLWERRGQRDEDTWSPDDLAAARHRASQLELVLPARIDAFLGAGERRHRAQLRRRRLRHRVTLAVAAAIAVPAFIGIDRFLVREQHIRINAGTLELVLLPFDWVDGAPRSVPIDELPQLTWRMHEIQPGNPHEPGKPVPSELVQTVTVSRDRIARTDRVTAPGGMVFLEISGRGRGETCASSWIRLQAFPGYAGDRKLDQLHLEIPTCQASRADMKVIEGGAFVYGGPGEPASKLHESRDYDEPEAIIDLPGYAMDRTEISNAAYAPFGRMARITGYPAPIYSKGALHEHDSDPGYPATDIDAFGAEAFCRYMGKRLPGDHQWVKAARGGLSVNGVPNPFARRRYPWGPAPDAACVNQQGTADGFEWIAPVDSFACGASPYGLLNLVGNVQEWIARDGQTDRDSDPQHALRGGDLNSPPEREHASILFRNHRDPRVLFYTIGFRCVATSW